MWDECNCVIVWPFFDIAFLWDWNENWAFLVLWPLLKWSEVTQLCLTLCDPVDCSPPCSSVHGIFQARVLEWVAISFSVFQICWYIECSTFTASSFSIWNSSTRIPSPLLALFIWMLPKAHLTSHSRLSGSRRVIKPLWLSGSWRFFLYSSVFLPPLLNIFCFC